MMRRVFLLCGLVLVLLGGGIYYYLDVYVPAAERGRLMEEARLSYDRFEYGRSYSIWLPMARGGYGDAQAGLGALYLSGHGVGIDFVRSYMWLFLAAENGAMDMVSILSLVRGRLSEAELMRAESLIVECRESAYSADSCR